MSGLRIILVVIQRVIIHQMLLEVIDIVLLLLKLRVPTSLHHSLEDSHLNVFIPVHAPILMIKIVEARAIIHVALILAFTRTLFDLLDYLGGCHYALILLVVQLTILFLFWNEILFEEESLI